MELKGITEAYKLLGRINEVINGIGREIRRLGERLKQAKEGS